MDVKSRPLSDIPRFLEECRLPYLKLQGPGVIRLPNPRPLLPLARPSTNGTSFQTFDKWNQLKPWTHLRDLIYAYGQENGGKFAYFA
ncbi:hypothetical protein CEXT_66241 [Caerostris extrusa]|uniref:Uncharacterized protein n=1 Tax=Caerostris extrusa TaxID=172846 RepID=A0AAV4RTM3_CAEEX|nr:hypothetical protein CEXT_66241 [Caerostris extrusa]